MISMQANGNARRLYGTGSLFESKGSWFGKWRVGQRQVKRKVGYVRSTERPDALTRTQAERKLRAMMLDESIAPTLERIGIEDAGRSLLAHLRGKGRKLSTLEGYESYLRVHLVPHFGAKNLDAIKPQDVEAFVARCLANGQSVKSTRNYLGCLHSVFEHGRKKGWATLNPCKLIEYPESDDEAEIRFLTDPELERLLAAVPADDLGMVERPMYLMAAMTGLRQGELLALRWLDVDWLASRVRVRQNYVRGEYGTPKSKRSTRSVPLAMRVARELEALSGVSTFKADDELVFAHPHTGKPIDRSKLLKRYKRALRRASVREVRFHDLRHTFGTRCAAAGVPMRTLQEWMGHRDFKTTLIYADYAPGAHEADMIEAAFAGTNPSTNVGHSPALSDALAPAA
jgi:integrase